MMVGMRDQDNVATPKWLYDVLDAQHHFDHDPCPLEPTFDGLNTPWGSSNFVNPPYTSVKLWIKKALEESTVHKRKSVLLIPFRPSRKYWFDLVYPNAEQIYILEGGVRFDGYKQNAPMPLAVVVFGRGEVAKEPRNSYHVFFDDALNRRVVNLTK